MSDFAPRCTHWQAVAADHDCIFDNVRFVEDADSGVRMLAVRPDKPARLRVSQPLLIPREGIELTATGQCVLPPYCTDDNLRAVIDDYLAYILSPARVAWLQALCAGFRALPEPLPEKQQDTHINLSQRRMGRAAPP